MGLSDVNFARLLLIAAAALYGTNFSLVKLLGQSDLPVGLSSALRFGLAALATSPWLFAKNKNSNDVQAASQADSNGLSPQVMATLAGLEVGMWNSVGYVAQAVGLETTLASKSAFLCSLAVVTVPLLDFIWGKRLLPREMVGALLAIGGVAVLELGGLDDWTLTAGDWASLVQPVAFGIGFWRMEKAMHKYPNEANRSTAGQLMAVFLGSLLYCLATEWNSLDWHQIQQWIADPTILFFLFWTGCITTALTVYMETLALKTLSAAETTLIFSSEPLWGAAFASLIMGETLGWDTAVGAVFIVSGCLFSNLGIAGIMEFLTGKKSHDRIGEDGQSPAAEDLPQAMAALDPRTTPGSMVRFGTIFASLMGAAAGMWSNVAMGARVFAMQLSDFLESLASFDP
jgi:drug/metabolite transporter (DMT)-like permease